MSITDATEKYLRNALSDYGTNESVIGYNTEVFNIVTPSSTVTLAKTPGTTYPPFVYKNGVLLYYTTDYTRSIKIITFVMGLINGDVIRVNYNV